MMKHQKITNIFSIESAISTQKLFESVSNRFKANTCKEHQLRRTDHRVLQNTVGVLNTMKLTLTSVSSSSKSEMIPSKNHCFEWKIKI